MKSRASGVRSRRRQGGFSLIEVMIAILVLGLGLLGFAMLQTMSLRFTQSANYRTQATNLAYDLLDQMRANRHRAGNYTAATFAPGAITNTVCSRPTGTTTVANNITRWQCQVARTLGPSASAGVTYANGGDVTVTIAWGDQRWDQVSPNATTAFVVRSRL